MITSLNDILPIYIVGDSHVLAFRNLLFQETWAGSWIGTRAKYIPGFSAHQFFNPSSGDFHPGLIEALQYEGLVRDHRATHLSLEEMDYNVAKAFGRAVVPPILMLACGDIDIRSHLLPVLKDQYDFIPPFETPYVKTGKPLLAWDICEKILEDRLTPFITGLKQLKASGFNRIYVPSVAPPTLDEKNFLERHGYNCPASVRYKATVAFNRLLSERCSSLGIPVLDIWSQVTSDGYLRPEFELDGVHLAPATATMHLNLLLEHAINTQPASDNHVRHELHYRMACNSGSVFDEPEKLKGTAPSQSWLKQLKGAPPSPNWLKPMTNAAPPSCSQKAAGKVPQTAAPWVQPAVEEFAQKGICILKVDPRSAVAWKESLIFDRDVGNRHSAWDWTGNTIAPFSKNLRTAQVPPKLVDDLEILFSQLDFDLFFHGALGCPVQFANCRPIQSAPHAAAGSGPQSWHKDGCPAGTIRGILYLVDVDEDTGPFQYKSADDSVHSVVGHPGDLLIFDAMRLTHRALPPRKNVRTALDFVIMPRLRDEKLKVLEAGMNNWPADPFCFSTPSDKTKIRSETSFFISDSQIPSAAKSTSKTVEVEENREITAEAGTPAPLSDSKLGVPPAGPSSELLDMRSEIDYLSSVVQSAKNWQKRPWVKRAFHRWRAPIRPFSKS